MSAGLLGLQIMNTRVCYRSMRHVQYKAICTAAGDQMEQMVHHSMRHLYERHKHETPPQRRYQKSFDSDRNREERESQENQ